MFLTLPSLPPPPSVAHDPGNTRHAGMGQGKHPVTGQITPPVALLLSGGPRALGPDRSAGRCGGCCIGLPLPVRPFLAFFGPPILLPHVPPPGCPALRPGSMWFNGHPGACTKAIGGREREGRVEEAQKPSSCLRCPIGNRHWHFAPASWLTLWWSPYIAFLAAERTLSPGRPSTVFFGRTRIHI